MKQPITHLQEYISSHILPQYNTYDKGHNLDHIQAVIQNSWEIAQDYDVDINMVFAIAAYHDIGIVHGRENHHITSGEMLIADTNLNIWFSAEELHTMQEAIEDHRASNDYEPRTIYGKIISEADRVIDAKTILYRTMQYGKKYFPEFSETEQFERTYQHIEEKYGENGYLKLWLKTEKNTKGLEELRTLLKDKNAMKALCEAL